MHEHLAFVIDGAAAEDAAKKLQIDLIDDGCERVATALFKIAHANPQKIGLFR